MNTGEQKKQNLSPMYLGTSKHNIAIDKMIKCTAGAGHK
jgi:hypothetical protein